MRLILKPDVGGIVDALGGGPVIVRNGKPVFRANEGFAPDQLLPRNAAHRRRPARATGGSSWSPSTAASPATASG